MWRVLGKYLPEPQIVETTRKSAMRLFLRIECAAIQRKADLSAEQSLVIGAANGGNEPILTDAAGRTNW